MAHDQEVVGSNPGTVYWMDVSDSRYYIQTMKIKVYHCDILIIQIPFGNIKVKAA